ncbi:MAG: hypothetical protein ACYCZO_05755 [Daejeonella sp.]
MSLPLTQRNEYKLMQASSPLKQNYIRMKKISLLILWVVLVQAAVIAQDKFFDSNGVRIHYIEQGTGVPIVLVHGRGGTLLRARAALRSDLPRERPSGRRRRIGGDP